MGKAYRDYFRFITAAVQKPMEVSTIFPTFNALKAKMLHGLDFGGANLVVELGPGTGAITQEIAPRLNEGTQYVGIELHEGMASFLKSKFPSLNFVQGSAANVRDFTKKLGLADCVISSLPWTLFSEELQSQTLQSVIDSLKPGGQFVTYVCLNTAWLPSAKSLRNLLHGSFSSVKRTSIVWKNIPPAFVYHCRK